jgi:hypothetical protein
LKIIVPLYINETKHTLSLFSYTLLNSRSSTIPNQFLKTDMKYDLINTYYNTLYPVDTNKFLSEYRIIPNDRITSTSTNKTHNHSSPLIVF